MFNIMKIRCSTFVILPVFTYFNVTGHYTRNIPDILQALKVFLVCHFF